MTEIKDIVNHTLKAKLKENGFKTKASEWWKEIDGGYLMIHLKKSMFNNSNTGFASEVMVYAIKPEEMTEKKTDIWYRYQIDSVKVRDLLPEYGFFTEGAGGGGFDFGLSEKDYTTGKEYTAAQLEEIVVNIVDTYLMPFLNSINGYEQFNKLKDEYRKISTDNMRLVYGFFSGLMSCGMVRANLDGYVARLKGEPALYKGVQENMDIFERFIKYRDPKFMLQYEDAIRQFLADALRLAGQE